MIDPVTKAYIPNELVFKITMEAICLIVTLFFFIGLKKQNMLTVNVPLIFLMVGVLLDMIVLIGMFGMSLTEWATTVLPAYVIIFYGLYFVIRGRRQM